MIKDIEIRQIKISELGEDFEQENANDIKYDIYLKGSIHPNLFIYYKSNENIYNLMLKDKYFKNIRFHNTLITCKTLQEARKEFYLYHIHMIKSQSNKWYKWAN